MSIARTHQAPGWLEELKTRHRVRNINTEHQAQLTVLERMALFISDRVGTPGFFLLIVVWTASWILWNVYAPASYRFDRGMEFAVWIFVSNIIQLALMPLLLIAGNLQNRRDELRAENEYEVNLKSAQEIETVLGHLHTLVADIAALKERLDLPVTVARNSERLPDLAEEQFAQRQQEMLDAMALKLAQTHEQAVQRAQQSLPPEQRQ